MSRFVFIHDDNNEICLNTRFITSISMVNDEKIRINLYDRSSYVVSCEFLPKLLGSNEIAQVVPVDNLMAAFGRGDTIMVEKPLLGVAVTASGEMHPLGYDGEFQDKVIEDFQSEFMGMYVDGEEE